MPVEYLRRYVDTAPQKKRTIRGSRLPNGASLCIALSAVAFAVPSNLAHAASVTLLPGLDGMIRVEIQARAADQPAPLQPLLLEAPASVSPSSLVLEKPIATTPAPDASPESPRHIARATDPKMHGQATPTGRETSKVAPDGAGSSPVQGGARPTGSAPYQSLVKLSGKRNPCYWGSSGFNAIEHRNRCGYPYLALAQSKAFNTIRLAGSMGGFGNSRSLTVSQDFSFLRPDQETLTAPAPQDLSINPKQSPIVQPVPLPPAWLLLSSLAAPLLLRRRKAMFAARLKQ